MKLQDLFPYNKTILGLDGKYLTVGDDSYLINSDCIMAEDHIITTGRTYLLFDYSQGKIVKALLVVLKLVLYIRDEVYVLLIDILTQDVLSRSVSVERHQSKRHWKLVDPDVINVNNLYSNESQSKSKTCNNDDLLEFCF